MTALAVAAFSPNSNHSFGSTGLTTRIAHLPGVQRVRVLAGPEIVALGSDGAPLVGKETHDARTEAHAAFDTLWTSRDMTRAEAYRKLAVAMQMRGCDCHIKLMDAATARRVVEVVASMKERVT